MTILKSIAWGVLGLFVFLFAVMVLVGIFFGDSGQDNLGITFVETAAYFEVHGFSIDKEGSGVLSGSDKLFVVMNKPGYTALLVGPRDQDELTSIQIVAKGGYNVHPSYFLEIVDAVFGDCLDCLEWFDYATKVLDGKLQEELETTLDGRYVNMTTNAGKDIILRMTIKASSGD